MRPTVDNLNHRIGVLLQTSSLLTDDQLRAEISKYLVILGSSYIEVSLKKVFDDFTKRHANEAVQRYVRSQLTTFTNPKFGKILDLCSMFDPERRKRLEDALDESQKSAIDSIVNNRNQLAHGDNPNMSIARFTEYFEGAKKCVRLVAREFGN